MKRFLIILLGLIVLLVVLDRAGALIAQREISLRVRHAYHLSTTPDVSVRGIPFLTQLVSGHYQEIDVSISSAKVDGLQVRNIDTKFTGVHASLSLLLGQNHGSATASHASGTALIPYSQVERKLPGLKIAPDGSNLKVSGAGILSAAHAIAHLAVSNSAITVRLQLPTLAGIRLHVPTTFTLPLSGLPMHLSVTNVHVTQGGLLVDAAAHNVTFASG